MKSNTTTNILLVVIALLLVAIVLAPLRRPETVLAQSPDTDYYFEPGTFLVRAPDNSQQVYAKVVVDLRNGRVWGFPTLPAASLSIRSDIQQAADFASVSGRDDSRWRTRKGIYRIRQRNSASRLRPLTSMRQIPHT